MKKIGRLNSRRLGLRYPAKYEGIVWAVILVLFVLVSSIIARKLGYVEQSPKIAKLVSLVILSLFLHKFTRLFKRHQWQSVTLFCTTLAVIVLFCGGVEYVSEGRVISSSVVSSLIVGGTALLMGIYCGVRWWFYMRYLRERLVMRGIATRRIKRGVVI